MVAFAVSLVFTLAFLGAAVAYSRRRPPLTWVEAMVASVFVFFVMFLAYGVVPHQWLTWADNELNWRADKVLLGPGNLFDKLPFTLTYQVIRDIVAATIYIIFLGVQIALWTMWQARGKAKPAELPVSSFGRPLVKRT